MRKKRIGKILSYAITFCLLITLVPGECIQAAAASLTESGAAHTSSELAMENVDAEAFESAELEDGLAELEEQKEEQEFSILGEIVGKRDENTKHFALSDKSYIAVIYDEPVHYKKNGRYLEIDNNLKLVTSLGENGEKYEAYYNTANSFKVELPSQIGDNNMIGLVEDGYSIKWAPADTEARNARAELKRTKNSFENRSDFNILSKLDELDSLDVNDGQGERIKAIEKELTLNKESSELRYNQVKSGVDLVYTAISEGLKEDIIINSPLDSYDFTFNLHASSGLLARENGQGEIEFYHTATNEITYVMPAPFMFDAEGEISNEVKYVLRPASARIKNNEENTTENAPAFSEEEEPLMPDADTPSTENAREFESVPAFDNTSAFEDKPEFAEEEVVQSESDSDGLNAQEPIAEEEVAAEEPVQDIHIKANSSERAEYILTISADKEWIEARADSFPITIDPVLKKYRKKTDVSGNYSENKVVSSHAIPAGLEDKYLILGNKSGQLYRSYMNLKLPSLPAGTVIDEALLYFKTTSSTSVFPTSINKEVFIKVHEAGTFNAGATWANQPYTNAVEKLIDYHIGTGTSTSPYFNITKAVNRSYGAAKGYCALQFTAREENLNEHVSMYLRERASDSSPYLVLTYRSNVGLESYWSTHSAGVGRGGTGYVNHFSGNLVYVHDDVQTVGGRMPMNIQHIYDTYAMNRDIDPATKAGKGFRLNYQQTLKVPVDGADLAKYPYVYTDADGTEHYMKKNTSTTVYNATPSGGSKSSFAKDEDGLGLFVVEVTDGTLQDRYPLKIQDKSGSMIMYFDKIGRLGMITDSNQKENASNAATKERNKIEINYASFPTTYGDSFYTEFTVLSQKLDTLFNYAGTSQAAFDDYIEDALAYTENMIISNEYVSTNLDIANAVIAIQDYLFDGLLSEATISSKKTSYTNKARTKLSAAAVQNAITGIRNSGLFKTRLTSVKDAAGKTANVSYNAEGYISTISDPTYNGQTVKYTYVAGAPTTIEYPDGKRTYFTYESGKLRTAADWTGYKLTYTYSGNKVSMIEESMDGATGQKIGFTHNPDYTTAVRFSGKDDIYGNSDDVINVYTFNTEGKTETIHAVDMSGKIFGAALYEFTETAEGSAANNKLLESAVTGYNIANLLKNHGAGFGNDGSWIVSAPTASQKMTYDTTSSNVYIGKNSFKVNATAANTNKSGFYQNVSIPTAGDYTLSGYMKTAGLTGNGAFLEFKQGSGMATRSELIKGTTDEEMNGGWARVSLSFYAQAGIATVFMGFESGIGTAWFDCLQLEKGTVASEYNILENASFELGPINSGTDPYGWKSTNTKTGVTVGGSVDSGQKMDGTYSYKIQGEQKTTKTIYQTISTGGSSSDTYVLSGWVKTATTPTRSGRYYKLDVQYYTTAYNTRKTIHFNTATTDWSYFSVIVKGSIDRVKFTYDDMLGDLYIDNLQLVKQESVKRAYNSDGKTTLKDVGKKSTKYTYSCDRVYTVRDPGDSTVTYHYSSTTNDVNSISVTNKANTYYTYDKYGNVTDTKQGQSNTSTAAGSYNSATYKDNGNFLASVKDERGYVTSYDYNTVNGLLNSGTNAKNVKTNYTYNSDFLMTSVNGGGLTNTYGYTNKNLLSSVGHNGFQYSFQYDNFGNQTSVLTAGNTLSTNSYAANNGKLTRTTYGNGQYLENIYDEAERVKGLKYNGAQVYEWKYDNAGSVAAHTDSESNLKYSYEYNADGEVVRGYLRNINNQMIYEFQNSFDKAGRPIYLYTNINNIKNAVKYKYNNNNTPDLATFANGGTVKHSYESVELKRPSNVALTPKSGAAAVINTEYGYLSGYDPNGKGLGQTMLVSSLVNKIGTATQSSYSYEYDALGNISRIIDSGRNIYYTYDDLNRLTRENNQVINKSIVYTYSGGNILNKKEYAYTTGTLGAVQKTVDYTYDSVWKDKLLNYGTQSITYDTIGNPTNYRGNALVWEKGRQLKKYGSNEYKYNSDGQRIQKKVNGQVTEYTIIGGRLVQEKRPATPADYSYDAAYNSSLATMSTSSGTVNLTASPMAAKAGSTLTYLYDSTGELVGFIENNLNYYYYGRNAQGDITEIYNENSVRVCQYTYDTWGKLISVTGSNTAIGSLNPYRYRGYYYDTETGLYYLNSRYYDPETGRFLNADSQINDGILGANLFAYCENNPVMYVDPNGKNPIIEYVAEKIATVAVDVAATVGSAVLFNSVGQKITGSQYSKVSKGALDHIHKKHNPNKYAEELEYLLRVNSKASIDQQLQGRSFFNASWSKSKIEKAVNAAYKDAQIKGINTGDHSFTYSGEKVTIQFQDGILKTAWGDCKYTFDDLTQMVE